MKVLKAFGEVNIQMLFDLEEENEMLPKEFYPTPRKLLDKITEGIDWKMIQSVLEPSAGKGDIADYIKESYKNQTYHDNR